MSTGSPLIRLIPLQPSQLPSHPLLTSTDSSDNTRPDLLPFALALLNQANEALEPMRFNQTFKSHSRKPSPPSNTEVEALTGTIPTETIHQINWSDPATTANVGRTKPREIPTEHWFARRSYHTDISSKINPATASWEEFVFGLRDNHSLNEQEFTPTLYDARHILDWNSELQATAPADQSFTDMTLSVYEMCHEVPFPLQPRAFAVLVATASTSQNRFIAVTVPVNLSSFEHAFYSNGRNKSEGEDSIRRKQVVLGIYCAIEACELTNRRGDGTAVEPSGEGDVETKKEQSIEWIMGTASDAKGNLPMFLQKNSMPGMVVKDVGYFLDWISTVDEDITKGLKPYPYPDPKERKDSAGSTGSGGKDRRRSRTGSSAR